MNDRNIAKAFLSCPFCSRLLTINERDLKNIQRCPICNSPIQFKEYYDEKNDVANYYALPKIEGVSFEKDGFTVENGRLTSYNGCKEEISIPNGVISIGDGVFKDNKILKKVVFPTTICHVEKDAFCGCEYLTHVEFNEQLKTISNYAFARCRRIKEFNLPQNLIAMGYEVFHGCDNLLYADIPMDIKWIEGSPYRYCRNLKRATVPNCVTSLMVWFSETENVEVYRLGKKVKEIKYLPLKKAVEIFIENPYGWEVEISDNGFSFEYENADSSVLQNPKIACNFIKKLSKDGRSLKNRNIPENTITFTVN